MGYTKKGGSNNNTLQIDRHDTVFKHQLIENNSNRQEQKQLYESNVAYSLHV